ncbi:sensor protein BceS [Weizmannia acidilactici]|uniref:histidine kinase n=1 Tax=Weizmannia acidilactici TaxID=2607726 RepID=A0A5J4JIA7_9BACI|nr:sensor histidine kinase [Weizmannia acidilactici]GER71853.1 sensor protein BceS [Weizmannia acidilactici]
MIRMFLDERKSWLMIFITQQLLLLFIASIDRQFAVQSAFYIIFLNLVIFLLFLLYRYRKETKFYAGLKDWDESLDLNELEKPDSPFEKLVETALVAQTENLKADTARNVAMLEVEKDELTAWVHEIKTPMTAMQLMIDRIEDENTKASLSYEWLRIHLLLDKQLHQKRIGNMENDLYIENVDLKRLIHQEIKALRSWCIQKGIGFDIQLNIPKIVTDAKWLAFILRQLITNAVKYSEGTDITISGEFKNGRLHLAVADHGCGIDPKDLPRIFEKGFTSTDRNQNTAATGLGLYLAKRAAEKLHIRLTVQSAPGTGSTFTLIFPRKNEFQYITGM